MDQTKTRKKNKKNIQSFQKRYNLGKPRKPIELKEEDNLKNKEMAARIKFLDDMNEIHKQETGARYKKSSNT
jgi:hypothetical protein